MDTFLKRYFFYYKKWKEENVGDQAIDFLEKNPGAYYDQDALNAVVNGRWKSLPLKYNAMGPLLENKFLINQTYFEHMEVLEARNNPIVIHYTGRRKPWYYKSRNPYQWLYWKYLALTPYKDYKAPDKTVRKVIKKYFARMFNKNILES